MTVKPIPDGYHEVTPYLIVKNAAKAIEFYKSVFGAREKFRMADAQGRVGHAELGIGGSIVMMADEHPQKGFVGPQTLGGTPVSMLLYVPNVDEVTRRAVDAGAKVMTPVQDQFYGDRTGTVQDPFGHVWTIATHKEDVSPEEMKRRADAMMQAK
jgi:PhnB protein